MRRSKKPLDPIPDDNDWHDPSWIFGDETSGAYGTFFGKSIEQVVPLFAQDIFGCQDDVDSMPAPCLRYYIRAYIAYLMSDASQNDPDGARCFLGLVKRRMPDLKNAEPKVVDVVVAALRHIAERQEWYDAAEWIYGDFKSQAGELIDKLEA
ncbi:MAG: hypothetical protein SH850_26795 [Planctomycetaceae bacterium]|nr:hypothetical protein [Planctomycetaceae bacterium]